MHPTEDLIPILKKVRLSGVLESLDLRRRQAVDDSLSFDEFLYRLLYDEVERRDGKEMASRLRRANFEGSKPFDSFDMSLQPRGGQSPEGYHRIAAFHEWPSSIHAHTLGVLCRG